MPKEAYHADESAASLQAVAREIVNLADRALRAGDSELRITSVQWALHLCRISQGFKPFGSNGVFVDWLRSCSVVRRELRPRRFARAGERET